MFPPLVFPNYHSSFDDTLKIGSSAQLDIGNGFIIIEHSSEGVTGASNLAVRNLLINGRNGGAGQPGAWNGLGGITSSYATLTTVGGNGNGFNLAVGYGDNGELASVRTSGSYLSFGGQSVTSTMILIRMTRGADATLDGVVDSEDVTILNAHYNNPGSGLWCFADFDYSGTCDNTDVTTLNSTFGKTTPVLAPSA